MVFQVKTESGSTYEVDEAQSRVRRIVGKTPGRPELGTDGAWKQYKSLSKVETGRPMIIVWENDKATITSRVAA